MSKINKFKWTYELFGHNYRVTALSTLYLTVAEIILLSLKSKNNFFIIRVSHRTYFTRQLALFVNLELLELK